MLILQRYKLNTLFSLLGMLIPAGILLTVLYVQFVLHESPCPLCLLQRCGYIGYLLGMFMNLKYGYSGKYIGLSILSAMVGIFVSLRQILLHINSSHGKWIAIMGLHMYTWSFVCLVLLTIYACFVLMAMSVKD